MTDAAAHALPDLADWMLHGLYDAEAGYYAAGRVKFGHRADFWTFPTRLSPCFGTLLAEHLAGLRARLVQAGDLAADATFDVVELGAGTGALARDVWDALGALSTQAEPYAGLARTLRYRIGERSPALQRAQRALLGARPVTHLAQGAGDAMPLLEPMVGVILHNELLDVWPHALLRPTTSQRLHLQTRPKLTRNTLPEAMRAAYAAGDAAPALSVQQEWQPTTLPDDPYLRALAPLLAHRERADRRPAELLYAPELPAFARWAAQSLRAGWMLTIDYGGDVTHHLDPAPALAQLRLFPQPESPPRRLSASAALVDLDWPGRQDVTVDIDFSHLAYAGELAGLRPMLHGPQGLLMPGSSLSIALGTIRSDLLAPAARRQMEAQLRREQRVSALEAAQLIYSAARGFAHRSAGFRLLLQERDGTRGGLGPALAAAQRHVADDFAVRLQDLPRLRADATAAAIAAAIAPWADAFTTAPLRPAGSLLAAIDEAGLRADRTAILAALRPLLEAPCATSP